MNHFKYQDGALFAEDVSLAAIAAQVGTPFYCYSSATLERHYHVFAQALPQESLVAFSVKANGNLAVLKTLADLGAGADVVSGGELKRALAAGIPGEKIVFSGVGKTKTELAAGLKAGIYQFNVESEPELKALDEVAHSLGVKAPVAFRVNPDVDAHTHAKISTGHAETKFGVPWAKVREAYALAAKCPNVDVVGIDVHIGSQITELSPFAAAFARVVEMTKILRTDGHVISRIDLGGGLGVPYRTDNFPPPEPAAYGKLAAEVRHETGARLIFEPGRMIVANAGVLVTKVIYVKQGENRQFLIVDAGMNDLIRPALYEAHHDIVPLREAMSDAAWTRYDVVGPVCETSDIFGAERAMPVQQADDLVAILAAGAYGAVMSSAYNARPLAPEVLVKGSEWAVIRPRMDDDAYLSSDRIPAWLG